MKLSRVKDLSMTIKILIVVAIIVTAAVWDYMLFTGKSEQIELYDDLHSELSSVRVSVANLEYTLDMFVVARRIDNTTLMLIRRDMEHIDTGINKVIQSADFKRIMKENPRISEDLNSIFQDWQTIKSDLSRLKEGVSPEELILIHNAVDVKTILIIEMTDRDVGVINQKRGDLLDDINSFALATCVGFAFISIIAASIFYRRSYFPAMEITRVSEIIASGGVARFGETGAGYMRGLSLKLNLMTAAINERLSAMDAKMAGMAEEIKTRNARLEIVNAMNASIARSISLADVFQIAVKEAVASANADGAAVYFVEEGVLRLKASSGFSRPFPDAAQSLPLDAFASMPDDISTRFFADVRDYTYEIMRPVLGASGFTSLISVPIKREAKTAGYFYALFKGPLPESGAPFFEAAAQAIEGYIGYTRLYSNEKNQRRFFERVIDQMPMGVAVFDRHGMCSYANGKLKKLLNAHPDFDFVEAYSVMDDEAFRGEAVRAHILNIYAGYTAEFTVEYQPSLTARFGFGTTARRFKVKGLPLYDLDGEISSIMLLYEPAMSDAPGALQPQGAA